jgi:hypothetical protein
MLFPIANGHDNPWLLPDGSHPSILRTRKTFPFRYFHITIFLSYHPERVRDLGLEIHTARGSRESILFRWMVSSLHDISYLDHFTTYAREAFGVKLGIQFISGKCEFPRRWKHTHNIAISHRDVHTCIYIYIYVCVCVCDV